MQTLTGNETARPWAHVDSGQHRPWILRLARFVTNVLSPPVASLMIVIIVADTVGSSSAWAWAALFALTAFVPPLGFVAWLLHTGRLTDVHMPERSERIAPFVVTLTFAGIGLAAIAVGSAPTLLVAIAAAAWLLAGLLFVITLRWKVSTHGAAVGALATLAVATYGATGALAVIAVPLVGWSRLYLRRHDMAQVVSGSALGAGLTALALIAV